MSDHEHWSLKKRRGLYFLVLFSLIFIFYFLWPPSTSRAPIAPDKDEIFSLSESVLYNGDENTLDTDGDDYVYAQETQEMLARVPGLECLEFGHNFVERHIHATLTIYVDDAKKMIPTDIGITDDCMSEIHTHANSGKIHIETVSFDKTFTLQDFFDVWQKPLVFKGYRLDMMVNERKNTEYGDHIFRDDEVIILRYTKEGSGI